MRKKLVIWLFAAFFGTMLAQSCNTAKRGCGCGSDLNKAYRPKRIF